MGGVPTPVSLLRTIRSWLLMSAAKHCYRHKAGSSLPATGIDEPSCKGRERCQ